jgi:hypothetical protein
MILGDKHLVVVLGHVGWLVIMVYNGEIMGMVDIYGEKGMMTQSSSL